MIFSSGLNARELSIFQRLVLYLENGPAEERVYFAEVALTLLASAYETEARMAGQGGQDDANIRAHWSGAVRGYAREMVRLKELVEQGAPFSLILPADQGIAGGVGVGGIAGAAVPMIAIGDYQVMLSSPRLEEQAAFEQEILTQVCTQVSCAEILEYQRDGSAETRTPRTLESIKPVWEFTVLGPACSYQSIRIAFELSTEIDDVRVLCKELFAELNSLLEALSSRRRYGAIIEWPELAIAAMPERSEHAVTVNSAGDVAILNLPLLYGSPELLGAIKPWLVGQLLERPRGLELKAREFNLVMDKKS